MVEIDHSRGIMTVYGHLSRFAKGTRVGQHVTQGNGHRLCWDDRDLATPGPHLHYEYRVNGVFKNPQTVSLCPTPSRSTRVYADPDFQARGRLPVVSTHLREVSSGPVLVAR